MPSSFQDWLEKWQNRSEKIPCYNPRNMQTFAFLCKASSSHLAFQNPQRASHISYPTQNPKAREWRRKSWRSWPTDTDVKEAIVRMHNTSLVGITAHFKASLCLLQARVFRTMPRYCDCRNRQNDEVYPEGDATSHFDHGVQKHNTADLSPAALSIVDALTHADRRLYIEATRRFRYDVSVAEEAFQVKLLC